MNISSVEFSIVEQGADEISQIKGFWLTQLNKIFNALTGKDIQDKYFYEQSQFYVLKFDGKIGCIMSSAWQMTKQIEPKDSYYEAWPATVRLLDLLELESFLKMGMIISDHEVIPKGFKLAHVIVGCGVKYAFHDLKASGIISFPRTDNPVFKSCFEWGSMPIKTGLTMYNTPVNLILLTPESFREHSNTEVAARVETLFNKRVVYGIKKAA